MKDCQSPIYKVLDTIAGHSAKLFMTVSDWKDATDEPTSNDSAIAMTTDTNQDTNDLYLCNIPSPKD